MRSSITVLLFCLSTIASAVEFGKISFVSSTFDFGKRHRGESISAVYNFENKGKGELMIEGVHAECGCIDVNHLVGQVFFPGDKGRLEVKFDSHRFKGKVSKKIVVVTNTRGLSSNTLRLTGHLESSIEANPPIVYFSQIKRNETANAVVELHSPNKTPFDVKELNNQSGSLALEKSSVVDGKIHLNIKLNPKELPYGVFRDRIEIVTNHPKQEKVFVLVRAKVMSRLRASEKYLEFGDVKNNSKNSELLSIEGVTSWEDVKISSQFFVNDVELSDSDSLLGIAPVLSSSNKGLEVKVSLNREILRPELTGPIRGLIHISSRDDEFIKIPVYGYLY